MNCGCDSFGRESRAAKAGQQLPFFTKRVTGWLASPKSVTGRPAPASTAPPWPRLPAAPPPRRVAGLSPRSQPPRSARRDAAPPARGPHRPHRPHRPPQPRLPRWPRRRSARSCTRRRSRRRRGSRALLSGSAVRHDWSYGGGLAEFARGGGCARGRAASNLLPGIRPSVWRMSKLFRSAADRGAREGKLAGIVSRTSA